MGAAMMIRLQEVESATGSLTIDPLTRVVSRGAPSVARRPGIPDSLTSFGTAVPMSSRTLNAAARGQLDNILESEPQQLHKSGRNRLLRLLDLLMVSGMPYPQVKPNPLGGVEVNWLVGGCFAGLAVDSHGAWIMWALDDDGRELIEVAGESRDDPAPGELVEMQRILEVMGRRAAFWPVSAR
ncbi:MAG: hypothetical protein QG597_2858 [Actinomycetota bacterium]|nr:hypothetical protein [Actinomycetota bacterium]